MTLCVTDLKKSDSAGSGKFSSKAYDGVLSFTFNIGLKVERYSYLDFLRAS